MTVSPDLNLANALNAASAFQFPGSEPVEIFQAELFTILEKLASGATSLSVEDELQETESHDEDSSANPPVNDEANAAMLVNARPALAMLPEFRTGFSLSFLGRLEAPASEPASAEPGALPDTAVVSSLPVEAIDGAGEELIIRQLKTSEDQATGGLPEDDSSGDIAFAAEITRAEVDDSPTAEEVSAQKPTEAKREPLRQTPVEHRNPGGEREKQHTTEPRAPRIESSNDAGITTPKSDFEPLTRPEPRREAAPVATAKPLAESAEPVQKTPSIAQQPLRDLSLGLVSEQARVGIQVRESEGTLQVSVRTPDAGVSAALQKNLDELAATLSKQGLDTQFWTPSEDHRLETHASERAGDSEQSSPDWQGRGNGGQDGGSQHKQNQRSRAGWLNTLSTEQDADTKENEVTSWPFNSQIFQTRR